VVATPEAAGAGSRPAGGAGSRPAGGLAQAIGEQLDLKSSIGGPRGVLESVLPVTVFSIVYAVTQEIVPSVVAALVPAVVLAVWRVAAREPLTQTVSGLLGIGIGAVFAVRTGRAEGFFLPGILKNAGFAAAYAVSALVRWPLIGVFLGFVLGELLHWRSVPARMTVYVRSTWVWAGMFAVRVAVQLPLYLAGAVTVLGFVNIALGIPLFAVAVWATWVLVRRVPPAIPPEDPLVVEEPAAPRIP
jgi:hypothetical protein